MSSVKDATNRLTDNRAITDAQFDRLERILKQCIRNSGHQRKESRQQRMEMQPKFNERYEKLKQLQKKTDRAFELLDRKMDELRKRNPKH